MRRGLQFLISVVTFGLAIGQANDLNFCTKYATCRSTARSQLMKCAGGISQMIMAKHAPNISVKDEAEKIKLCNKRFTQFFTSSESEYEFIDKKILECTKSAHSNTNPLEKTQELICQAIHKETNFDNAAIQGIQTNSECYQVYESELSRCNLIRDCCPQFEGCRDKVEKESGIVLRERGIAWRIKKCIDNPTLNETLRAHDDVVSRPVSTQSPNPFEALLPRPTPVPRTKNNTLTSNGSVFIIKPPQKLSKRAQRRARRKEQREQRRKKFQEQQEKIREQRKRIGGEPKKIKEVPKAAKPVIETTTINVEFIAQEVARRLQEYKATQTTTVQSQTTQPVTESSEPSTTELTTQSTTELITQSTTELTTQSVTESSEPSTTQSATVTQSSTTEAAIKLNVTQDDPTKTEVLKKADEKTSSPTSNSNSILNELLCRQTAECIDILQREERECDITFGQDKSDESGIKDIEIRAIFLNNSKTDDLQIRRKCLANVDKETQKHLIHLKKQIKRQDEQCAYDRVPNNLDLSGCQKIDLLSEFSLLKRANSDQLIDSLDKCKRRLVTFRHKCESLKRCCPQRTSCTQSNQSEEVHKFVAIEDQLKMEQILCETRLQRVHDGISR